MKIEIFGPGCPKCKQLYKNTIDALAELGVAADVEKVEDINRMVERGIMLTPALSVNGDVKSSGKVMGIEEIKKIVSGRE